MIPYLRLFFLVLLCMMSGADVHCVDMLYNPTYVRTVLVVLCYDSNFGLYFIVCSHILRVQSSITM